MAMENMGNRTEFDRQIPSPGKRKRNRYALMCAIFASTTSILLGYEQSMNGGEALIFIQQHFKLSDFKVEIFAGVNNIYTAIGAAVAGRTSDYIGRRYTMVLAGFIFFVGAFLMGFANNYVSLMLGKSIIGLGTGYALVVSPVYITEVSPTSSRGFFTSLTEVFINFGIMLGYLSNFLFSKLPIHLGWSFMVGIGIFLSMFLVVVILMIPESPRWLVMQGQIGKAKWVLDKTSDSIEEAERRLADIKEANGIPSGYSSYEVTPLQVSTRSNQTMKIWKELFLHPTPSIRHILVATIGLHVFQQASMITVIFFFYSSTIVKRLGIKSNNHMLLVIILAGFTKTIFVLVATIMVDRIGRRPLLLTGVAGNMISLIILGFRLTKINHHSQVKFSTYWDIGLCITMILSYVAFFSIGTGPITWVYTSEIFPTKLRAQGVSAGVIVNRVTAGVVTMTFLSISNAITIGGVFYLHAAIAAMSWLFFYLLFPETQGRNLEDMEGLFGYFNPCSFLFSCSP
ncbi:putative polyol transporter 2 [Cucumis melo]|uniref:Polyol transporter 2 n=1 Tax=Cucumis melo TaxID=3656 RepID=A0A1S3BGH7_CUCME|nr:putative polyol transporter 2 [Cucumis melo]